LFLANTSLQLGNGELHLEMNTASGDRYFDVEEYVSDFKLFEKLF